MEKLWAPWRINYVSAKTKGKGCIFCKAKKDASGDHVIFKTKHTIVMLNIYPYNNGHILVAPLRHIRDISQLTQDEVVDIFRSLNRAKGLLRKVLTPQGYNIGLNITRTAGAGIDGHLHIHIVPRWIGDTNFMPVVSNTKVISQSLKELARCLKNADK
jgi:ATP adenylyltransferase